MKESATNVRREIQAQPHTRPERLRACSGSRLLAMTIQFTRNFEASTVIDPLVYSETEVPHQYAAPVRCACTSRERAELHVA